MNRRSFVAGSLGMGAAAMLRAQQCGIVAPGVTGCRTQIKLDSVMLAATLQHCPEWCWAASCCAVFKFFGHTVDQEEVVKATYGQLTCTTAKRAYQIAESLSRPWRDSQGRTFRLHISAAYDPQSNVRNINNAVIVNELNNGRPLLYCNKHHAMVICSADYRPSPQGPALDGMMVVDPWPDSPRVHWLTPAEIVPVDRGGEMTFLASLAIS